MNHIKKPNFFIIGAPKSGTTSMHNWLCMHPQVFMSDVKEPHFFNRDVGYYSYRTLHDYEALFRGANDKHLVVGESSTNYLWSKVAVPLILRYSPASRFLVMLRKPQEMAVSLHAQECGGNEDQSKFEIAWRMQWERAKGQNVPRFCRSPDIFQYGERCRVGTQLQRLFEVVPQERVLVIFLEDLRQNPKAEFKRVLEFLQLEEIYPPSFSVHNARREIRSFRFKEFLNTLGYLKTIFGMKSSTGLLAPFYRLNTTKPKKQELSESIIKELDEYFKPEILMVRDILGRVPEEWLTQYRKKI